MNTSMVELRGVSKTYASASGPVVALDDINLRIEAGEFLSLVGPSGSGKSTLLNLIGGIDAPSKGEVMVDGERVDRMGERDLLGLRRRKLAYVFQEPRLMPSLTALENVMLPAAFSGGSTGAPKRARHLLERVRMGGRLEHLPHQLSGGEAQRVALARALFSGPRLILADEPTGNLDHRTRIEIVELLDSLTEDGNTVVMVTHDSELADRARRKVALHDGRLMIEAQSTGDAPH
jgi:putative ABC transport system ATP-binding protein